MKGTHTAFAAFIHRAANCAIRRTSHRDNRIVLSVRAPPVCTPGTRQCVVSPYCARHGFTKRIQQAAAATTNTYLPGPQATATAKGAIVVSLQRCRCNRRTSRDFTYRLLPTATTTATVRSPATNSSGAHLLPMQPWPSLENRPGTTQHHAGANRWDATSPRTHAAAAGRPPGRIRVASVRDTKARAYDPHTRSRRPRRPTPAMPPGPVRPHRSDMGCMTAVSPPTCPGDRKGDRPSPVPHHPTLFAPHARKHVGRWAARPHPPPRRMRLARWSGSRSRLSD